MKLDDMIKLQDSIRNKLEEFDIFPFSVITTLVTGQGLCSITLMNKFQLKDFLKLLDYDIQCDKSGYLIIEDTNTIILSGIALVRLYSML